MSNVQKTKPYKRGDVVFIGDLPDSMRHFNYQNEHVVIMGSYSDQFGGYGRSHYIYTVMGADGNECSWYPHDVMSEVERTSGLSLAQWKLQQVSKLRNLNEDLN